MNKEQRQTEIASRIEELSRLVCECGLRLTHPKVVQKSMELDELILSAMKEYRAQRAG
ncbi:aspartyl-phosphate phosphatase Spo0E family protein [Paenibacillus hamazuiensis]|uniref:aspartyl-phosphate phosphatase Spo0E family protein n=1 Tax=Paenibacillus hamazuiensis TaxID=2936508 RepID=UPI00200FD931|nr:aspartyl-phosphate phosphatase Spo0E family protein [Paenibacillus hamazuiensis]